MSEEIPFLWGIIIHITVVALDVVRPITVLYCNARFIDDGLS